jgi:hypothetical protein
VWRSSSYLVVVYTRCLRCDKSLGTNSEIPHLRVGRKIAFDTTRGRLWVICSRCGQWNLTPFEGRWEALEECDRLAAGAEARSAGQDAGLAQTTSGLELLRVGGMRGSDIANRRYGLRIQRRQERQLWTLMPLLALAVPAGVGAWRISGAGVAGVYSSMITAALALSFWRRPPRPWMTFVDDEGQRHVLWPWQLSQVRLERVARERPVLVVPRMRDELRLTGRKAAAVLASLLPKFNGTDCATIALPAVLARVANAEKAATRAPRTPGRAERRRRRASGQPLVPPPPRQRAWEHLAYDVPVHAVSTALPEYRLALEIAVTEEMEQAALESRAEALTEEWRDEEEVGAISDDLLLPDSVVERLRLLRKKSGEDPTSGRQGC